MLRRPRPRTVAIGALAVLLAGAPFIPHGGDDDQGALRPSGDVHLAPAATAPLGKVTPQLQDEIDRVLQEGRRTGRLAGTRSPRALAAAIVRCADLDGQRYCLHSGWTEQTQAQVQARTASAARRAVGRRTTTETTGDADAATLLRRYSRMSPSEREAEERQELTMAARSVAKVWLLRHEVEGVDVPASVLAAHPEARVAAGSSDGGGDDTGQPVATTGHRKTRGDYPQRSTVMRPKQVAEQQRTYWCGPTTMQMIAWGWKDRDLGQAHWADKLGTTTSGTAITDMVRVVNSSTGWDNEKRAGAYITLDISNYSFKKWQLLLFRHIEDYRAPVVLHPILLKKYYPYLDDDASGHFQAGRGYDKRGKKPNEIGYFEPWNQQRFDPSEPYIARVQWRSAYKSYRANQAHFQHNIGV